MFPEVHWTERAEAHIGRHGVAPEEVEDVLFSRRRLVTKGREGTRTVFGTTASGRLLVVVVAEALGGGTYVVTARPMTGAEKRTFRRKGQS